MEEEEGEKGWKKVKPREKKGRREKGGGRDSVVLLSMLTKRG
jgi:hypothetical protein